MIPETERATLCDLFLSGADKSSSCQRLPNEKGKRQFIPARIDDAPVKDQMTDLQPGYLMPKPENDTEFDSQARRQTIPEEWQELGPRRFKVEEWGAKIPPQSVFVEADGAIGQGGRRTWFFPGKFRFCLACRHMPPGQAREITKLASLSAEGRSSATTLLVSSTLRWMNRLGNSIPLRKTKALELHR